MSDNVEFMSMTELNAKVTLDGTEEIQVSPSEKVNLLKVIQANAGRVNTVHINSIGGSGLSILNNHTDFVLYNPDVYNANNFSLGLADIDHLSDTGVASYTLVLRTGLGSTLDFVKGTIDQFNIQQDKEDPIVRNDGYCLHRIVLLGSGTYVFNITVTPSKNASAFDIDIDCKYTQPDNILRYRTYNNRPIDLSALNIESFVRPEASRYNTELNIGELTYSETADSDNPLLLIPTQAFSCYNIAIEGNNGPTTHFLSEVWLPSCTREVKTGAFTGCNYIRKFHGGEPGLISPDGTQILNDYRNGTIELIAVAPCALGSPVVYPGIGGFTRDEILTFYVDERVTIVGDMVFAYMPLSVPIRTVVFGRNVKTTGATTFFQNQCICTLILGDNFLQYNYGAVIGGGNDFTNKPINLSRLVCSNHIFNGVGNYGHNVEYLSSVSGYVQDSIKSIIEKTYPGSSALAALPNIMSTAYENFYPLDNEIIYTSVGGGGCINENPTKSFFRTIYLDEYLSSGGSLTEATLEFIYPLILRAGDTIIYPGFGTGLYPTGVQPVPEGRENEFCYRGLVNNPTGFDMILASNNLFGDTNLIDVAKYGITSIRFPKSVKAIASGALILSGNMVFPLDIYLYSPTVVLVATEHAGQRSSLFTKIGSAEINLQPVTIHVVKGLKDMYMSDWSWQGPRADLGDLLTIVDDLSTY